MRGHWVVSGSWWTFTRGALAALAGICVLALALVALLPGAAPAVAAEEACPSGSARPAAVDWGYNAHERLGLGFGGSAEGTPGTVQGLSNVRQVEAGFEFSLALTAECTLMAWGNNRQGQLGDGKGSKSGSPQQVVTESGPLTGVEEMAVGNSHAMALRYDGTVWTWGAAEFGERGNGESGWERTARQSENEIARPRNEAIEVAAVRTYAEAREREEGQSVAVRQIAAGGKRDYAVLSNGEVLGWGEDHDGILGVPESQAAACIGELHTATPAACVKTPTKIEGLSDIEKVDVGEDATYAIKDGGGEVLSWGQNDKGELGDGSTNDSFTPVAVELSPSSPVVEVSADGDFALALLEDGTVYGWGVDGGGQLGIEADGEQSACASGYCIATPRRIPSLDHVVAVAGGYGNSLALKEELNGEKAMYAFGHNGRYDLLGLGQEQEGSVFTPTRVTGLPSVAEISLSSDEGAALLEAPGPPPAVELTPGLAQLEVTWHVAAEGFKLRYRPFDRREFSKSEQREGCDLEPACESFTFDELNPEPYEVEFTTTKNEAGKVVSVKTRKAIATPEPAANAPHDEVPPYISASTPLFHAGQTLTAHAGTWSPQGATFEYQWLRCAGFGAEGSEEAYGTECGTIEGATGETYTPATGDMGFTLSVEVKAIDASGWSAAATEPELVLGSVEEEVPPVPSDVTAPSITGSPLIGSTLTVQDGQWEPDLPEEFALPTISDRWFLCKNVVNDPEQESANETGSSCASLGEGASYTPEEPVNPEETAKERAKNSPIGKWVEVQEHARNAAGTGEKTSLAVEVLPSGPPLNLEPPTITGVVEKGQTLKIEEEKEAGVWPNVTHWTNAAKNPTYQWLRCSNGDCTPIEGATKPNYKIASEDVGSSIEVQEKVENLYGAGDERGEAQATSEPTVPVPALGAKPEDKVAPSIEGTAAQGATLTVTRGEWANYTTLTLAWKRCNSAGKECQQISAPNKEEATSYTLEAADVGHEIIVSEHAVSSGGTATELSAPTALVLATPPASVGPPTLKGTAEQGMALTEGHGEWTNQPTGYTYQWLRCDAAGAECTEIQGETGQSYEALATDVGATLRVQETASNGGGSSEPAVSAPSQVVAPAPPSNTEPPTISPAGPPEKGSPLTAQPGAWAPEPTGYSYKWQRCDAAGGSCAAIEGATAQTYTPGVADVGHALAVEVRASNESGWDRATSSATAAVAYPTPSVSSVEPRVGPVGGGGTVTITGQHLGEASAVHFGSAGAVDVERVSESAITATAPAGTGTVDVTVTTPYGTSAVVPDDEFTYVESPSVSGLAPATGATEGGTAVIITGTNMGEASAVDFGLTPAMFSVVSASEIEAFAPAGSGTVDVTVTGPFGTSPAGPADRFTYVPPPSVGGVSPSAGPTAGATVVTISGEDLGEASAVHFGSASASGLEQVSATTLKATAPAGSGTVDVTVTTPYGTSATGPADQFTYMAAPTVTKVTPNKIALAGEGFVVEGTGFVSGATVQVDGQDATNVVVLSASALTATAPAHAPAVVDVTVTTLGGTSATSQKDHLTYAPEVTGISPVSGPTAGGNTVTVNGAGFATDAGATTIKFGSNGDGTGVSCGSSTECTVQAPAGPAGKADVQVTVNGAMSSKVSADRYTYE